MLTACTTPQISNKLLFWTPSPCNHDDHDYKPRYRPSAPVRLQMLDYLHFLCTTFSGEGNEQTTWCTHTLALTLAFNVRRGPRIGPFPWHHCLGQVGLGDVHWRKGGVWCRRRTPGNPSCRRGVLFWWSSSRTIVETWPSVWLLGVQLRRPYLQKVRNHLNEEQKLATVSHTEIELEKWQCSEPDTDIFAWY